MSSLTLRSIKVLNEKQMLHLETYFLERMEIAISQLGR